MCSSYNIGRVFVDLEHSFFQRLPVVAEGIGRSGKEPFPTRLRGETQDAILKQDGINLNN
jgi:hypothetical protein